MQVLLRNHFGSFVVLVLTFKVMGGCGFSKLYLDRTPKKTNNPLWYE